ncbi:hypothetical protein COM69_02585 [Bacillus toyonensis]|nr:hypothetical protein DPQ31_25365 [Bacillus sp. COPE52]PDY92396.1 hypothetical protein CON67_07775 [Bacillus toyonensis]PGE71468.1 hypothetical protein COM69_02585 [Bacillus toyonensis]PHD40273.1 hypothetical protein COF65_19435 [Bacillus toyonensis]PRT16217.1 hypothetical protein C6353_17270 [Bacillus toyonensis]
MVTKPENTLNDKGVQIKGTNDFDCSSEPIKKLLNVSFIKAEMYSFLLFLSLFKIFAEPPLSHLHNYR